MPRSTQEIIDHADELAQQLEDYEPSPDDEISVTEHSSAVNRAQAAEAIGAARTADLPL